VVRHTWVAVINSANPKSHSFRLNASSTSRFSNLMSLCTKPLLWRYWTAPANYMVMYLIEFMPKGFPDLAKNSKKSKGHNNSVINQFSQAFESTNWIMLWCLKDSRILISFFIAEWVMLLLKIFLAYEMPSTTSILTLDVSPSPRNSLD